MKFGDPRINLSRHKHFHLKPSEAAFSTVFFAVAPDRKWLVSDVVSGVVVHPVGVTVHVKCGDSSSNRSRHIRLPHFV